MDRTPPPPGQDATEAPAPSPHRERRRVVVGIDGSATAAHALEVARAEAELQDAALEIVWAWDLDDIPVAARPSSHAWAQAHVDCWAAPALGGPRSVSTLAPWGSPGPKVVEASEGADLVVVGARPLGRVLGFHLGSVSRHVVDHCEVPVMVVRDGSGTSPVRLGGPVVVGIDGSDPSRRALRWALHEAARRQVGVVAVHGWIAPAGMTGPVPTTMQPANVLQSASHRLVESELEAVRDVCPVVPREGVALARSGADAVLTAVPDAELVVVGCRGRGSLVHRALGSVSHLVVTNAQVPVVTVR